jgi:hypothetical protein
VKCVGRNNYCRQLPGGSALCWQSADQMGRWRCRRVHWQASSRAHVAAASEGSLPAVQPCPRASARWTAAE